MRIFQHSATYTKGYLLLLPVFLFLFSCSKEPIREQSTNDGGPSPTTYDNGIFIINEGNFNWGNASITYINNKTNIVEQDVFRKVNDRPLGDVAQSMSVFNDMGFIVVNNSNKVEVVSLADFKSVKSISGFNSPRYIAFVDSSKAYVTNLQHDVSIIDLNSLTITKTITTMEWTESMVVYKNYLFVTCIGTYTEPSNIRKAKLLVIDTKQDKVIDSIQTGKEPVGVVIDKKDRIWVLCTGGFDYYEPASLIRINPDLLIPEKVFTFPSGNDVPSHLCINPGGDTLYFLKNGVFQMPVAALDLPSEPLIPANGQLFYGLAVHPNTGNIYVSDAVDYVQNGWAYQYSPHGQLIKAYEAGRIPGSFCFSPKSRQSGLHR